MVDQAENKLKIIHNRPLSPHVFIYKWQITNSLSILHRLTGLGLFLGFLLLSWWVVVSIYSSFDSRFMLLDCLRSIYGKTVLFAWSFALFYHMLNGIRHLFWDAGYGFELKTVTRSGVAVVVGAILLTLLSWYIIYF